jgi:hypothetical protein
MREADANMRSPKAVLSGPAPIERWRDPDGFRDVMVVTRRL